MDCRQGKQQKKKKTLENERKPNKATYWAMLN